MKEVQSALQEKCDQSFEDIYKTFLHVIKSYLPHMAKQGALGDIEKFIETILKEYGHYPKVKIYTHPMIHEELSKKWQDDETIGENIIFSPDESLSAIDVNIGWGNGSIDKKLDAYLNEIADSFGMPMADNDIQHEEEESQ